MTSTTWTPTGQEVNTAEYSGTGAAGWHITTTEYDSNGNNIRALSAANREEALNPTSGAGAALELPADTAAAALALSDQSVYTTASDGVDDLTDSYGPYHLVTLADGTAIDAREDTHDSYDTGSETGHPAGGSLHLVTSETTGASESMAPVTTTEQDKRETDTAYALSATDNTGWTFDSPMKVTEDPGGLARVTITRYDPNTGAVIESRMPSNTGGGTAGTTLTIYYTAGTNSQDTACGNQPEWGRPALRNHPRRPTRCHRAPRTGHQTDRQLRLPRPAHPTKRPRHRRERHPSNPHHHHDLLQQRLRRPGPPRSPSPAVLARLCPPPPPATTRPPACPRRLAPPATTENAATSATTGYDDFGRVVSYVDANEATGAARNVTTSSYDTAGKNQRCQRRPHHHLVHLQRER